MCGIFGFSKKIDVDKNFENIFSDIKKMVNLSSSRGSDTFGVSFYNNKENFVYKLNQKPKKVVKNSEFKKFISNNLKKNNNNELILIGQNRLVTNGSKFSYLNNQPLITENIVGIHNGIFTNLDHSPSDKTINYESFNVKSDSLIFFEELSKIAQPLSDKLFKKEETQEPEKESADKSDDAVDAEFKEVDDEKEK